MLFDAPHMEDDMTDQEQEIWSSVRYLDPDGKDSATNIAAIVTVVAIMVVILIVWLLL
jgi:hypothetical protein